MLHPRYNRPAYLADKVERLTQERAIQLSNGFERRARILSERISGITAELAQFAQAA